MGILRLFENIMTWVEALPGIAIAVGCATVMSVGCCFYQRGQYRGVLDRRVPYGYTNERYAHCLVYEKEMKDYHCTLQMFSGYIHCGDLAISLQSKSSSAWIKFIFPIS